MRFARVTENNGVIPSILKALEFYPDVYAFRVESEGTRGRRPAVPKGTADILGVHKTARQDSSGVYFRVGQAFAIETKGTHGLNCNRKGCSCIDQREWRKDWERCGGLYILATDAQQAVDAVLNPLLVSVPYGQKAVNR